MRQYEDNQYYETPNSEQGFTNYERLLVELNNTMINPLIVSF